MISPLPASSAWPSWCAEEVTSRELVELYLERIERLDPELNAFRLVMAERALIDADQADARRAAGDERPLLGVPVAVKDDEDVAGEVTALGTDAYGPRPPRQRLRAPPARRRRGDHRQDEPARAGDHRARPRGRRSGSRAIPGTSSARRAARAAAAPRPSPPGSCRRRRRPTAPARSASRRPTAGCSGSSRSAGASASRPTTEHWHGLTSPASSPGRSPTTRCCWTPSPDPRRAVVRRGRRARRPGSCGSRCRCARRSWPVGAEVRAAVDATGELLRGLGHAVELREPRTGSAERDHAALPARHRRRRRAMARPERLQRRTRGFARLGSLIPDACSRRARATRPSTPRGSTASSSTTTSW